MADANVQNAQRYLNAMFGHHESWVPLEENGNTGTVMMEAIIRAFQIQNGVPNVTGYAGPYTIGVMKNLAPISKMDPSDPSSINVCLIQCALFSKGYNAGGITGIYYTTGVNAVKAMQADAGLPVTGIIDWKVWAGLLSMNWFKLVSGGDSTTRMIQQQLNQDYSDFLGVGPCDGVVSRNTAMSLIGALQKATGVLTTYVDDVNSLNFGPATTAACPTLVVGNADTDVTKIAQYGLYFNGYDPVNFDGDYTVGVSNVVARFQDDYKLLNIGMDAEGVLGVSTMKSILTSKGDTNRPSVGCDCSTVLNATQINDLYNAGYRYIGRYLTGTVGVGSSLRSKALTKNEIELYKNKLSVFPIYQDRGYYLNYFRKSNQGTYDAITALQTAKDLGFVSGTTIYFAVDFDCYGYMIDNYIAPYFEQINTMFSSLSMLNTKNYKVGIYAPREVCTKICAEGLATSSFVCDMSTGFTGNLGFKIPTNWAFDQFHEFSFNSSPSFDLVKVAVSGRDTGCLTFDATEEETTENIIYKARADYARRVLKATGYLGTSLPSVDGEKMYLGTANLGYVSAFVNCYLSSQLKVFGDKASVLNIGFNEDGTYSAELINQIGNLANFYKVDQASIEIEDNLKELALSAGSGVIGIEITYKGTTNSVISLTVQSELEVLPNLHCDVSFTIEFDCHLTSDVENNWEFNQEVMQTNAVIACSGLLLAMLMPIGFAAFASLSTKITTIFSKLCESTIILSLA